METEPQALGEILAEVSATGQNQAPLSPPRRSGLAVLPHRTGFAKILPSVQRSADLIDKDLRATINRLINGNEPWPLFLHGPAGTGKTAAALCLMDFAGGRYFTLPE